MTHCWCLTKGRHVAKGAEMWTPIRPRPPMLNMSEMYDRAVSCQAYIHSVALNLAPFRKMRAANVTRSFENRRPGQRSNHCGHWNRTVCRPAAVLCRWCWNFSECPITTKAGHSFELNRYSPQATWSLQSRLACINGLKWTIWMLAMQISRSHLTCSPIVMGWPFRDLGWSHGSNDASDDLVLRRHLHRHQVVYC